MLNHAGKAGLVDNGYTQPLLKGSRELRSVTCHMRSLWSHSVICHQMWTRPAN